MGGRCVQRVGKEDGERSLPGDLEREEFPVDGQNSSPEAITSPNSATIQSRNGSTLACLSR